MIARVKSWLGWWDNRAGTIPRARLGCQWPNCPECYPVTPQHLSRRK